MIKPDLIYECIDSRHRVALPLNGPCMLTRIPGGFELHNHVGAHARVLLEEDDQFEEVAALLVFHEPEGDINLTPLNIADWERLNGGEVFSTPPMKTTEELQTYWRLVLQN